MNRLYLLIFLFASASFLSAQEKYTINGYLKDASNGETLIGANVFIKELATGSTSNEYGFYAISIPEGAYTLEYSYLGYQTIQRSISLSENITIDIEFVAEGVQLDEIVIKGEAENANVSDVEISTNKLDIGTIQKMPTLLGEVEILRSIQLLPGVSSVGEGASGFNVRGGSIDQNLVLLDEAPVYNSSHLFGFFSVFNPDAVKDVKLYKGGIPSRYGGRLSSILDVRMKEGNSKNVALSGGIGAIFSRFAVEGPIIQDKASFIVAGRRSYADVLARPFLSDDLSDSALNFYDRLIIRSAIRIGSFYLDTSGETILCLGIKLVLIGVIKLRLFAGTIYLVTSSFLTSHSIQVIMIMSYSLEMTHRIDLTGMLES